MNSETSQEIVQESFTCQLTSFGVIQISGGDTNKFLQGQITTNVETIKPNKFELSAVCNPQGRCISLFFMAKKDQVIYLFLHRDTISDTVANLKKFAVFYKVDIQDITKHSTLYATHGNDFGQAFVDTNSYQVNWPEKELTIILSQFDTASDKQNSIIQQMAQSGMPSMEQDWFNKLVNKGVPWLNGESQSQFLPHNLNLPGLNAVDFKKGCFTGQEVIARMQYKGKLKSHMQLFQSPQAIECKPMDKIYVNDKAAAEVISAASRENGETSVLALVKDRYLDDKIFRLGSENGPILELTKTKD